MSKCRFRSINFIFPKRLPLILLVQAKNFAGYLASRRSRFAFQPNAELKVPHWFWHAVNQTGSRGDGDTIGNGKDLAILLDLQFAAVQLLVLLKVNLIAK